MKAETMQKGWWYKIFTDDGQYVGQVMQKSYGTRPSGSWGFGVGDQSPSFGHHFGSAREAAEALARKAGIQ